MKREFAMLMKASMEMGEVSAGGRRMTRSHAVVSPGKGIEERGSEIGGELEGGESKRMKTGVDEGKLEAVGRRMTRSHAVVSPGKGIGEHASKVGDELEGGESKRMEKDLDEGNLEEVGTNVGVELGVSEVGLIDVEKAMTSSKEDLLLASCTMSTPPKVESGHLDSERKECASIVGPADSGCEKSGEATIKLSKTSQKRFTRSALKVQDVEIQSELGVGKVESGVGVASTSSPSKLEMKMSKKVGLAKLPSKLKDLLHTGLLEGLNIRYIRGTKTRPRPESELKGVIRGVGILCSCGECKGEKIITPDQFELHAGSGNRSPPDYIYLENGKSLRDVLNTCKVAHSDSLEMVIMNAIGRSESTTNVFCLNCKGLIPEDGAGRRMLFCDSCIPKELDSSSPQIVHTVARSPNADSPAQVGSSCQLEAVISAQGSSNSRSRTKSQGKLTKKDLGMHRIVFTEDVLPDGATLHYVVRGMKRLEGFKKDGGIFCSCCDNVVSASQFEAHAGFASRRKPYDNIFTSNGLSLHKLALELSRNRKSTVKENDDLCSICEDGGDLLCCETCPRAFHTECVDLSSVPEESWYCRYCQHMFEKAKFEERSVNAIAAGRVPGVDPLKEITQRCIRIVETLKSDVGGCAICSGHDFTKKVFDDRTVIICDQCEKDYHVGCLRERNMADLKELPKGDWFCCEQCDNINSFLCKLIEEGEQRLPEALSDIVRKKSEDLVLEPSHEIDIKWRLLKGKGAPGATRKSLSDAVSIFHDRFDPIADSSTASLDLIPHLVYGRPFKGKDYRGMHCAILMVNSVVVSAAIFRIFGENVAEIPLVATRSDSQGKGYFQCLFFCIENLLTSLNVKNLVLPAADEAESLWKDRFGFKKLDQEQSAQHGRPLDPNFVKLVKLDFEKMPMEVAVMNSGMWIIFAVLTLNGRMSRAYGGV